MLKPIPFLAVQIQHSLFHLTTFISVIDLPHKAHYCKNLKDKCSTFSLLLDVRSGPCFSFLLSFPHTAYRWVWSLKLGNCSSFLMKVFFVVLLIWMSVGLFLSTHEQIFSWKEPVYGWRLWWCCCLLFPGLELRQIRSRSPGWACSCLSGVQGLGVEASDQRT